MYISIYILCDCNECAQAMTTNSAFQNPQTPSGLRTEVEHPKAAQLALPSGPPMEIRTSSSSWSTAKTEEYLSLLKIH